MMTQLLKNTPCLFLQKIFDCFQILSLGALPLCIVKHYPIISIAFSCMGAKNVALYSFQSSAWGYLINEEIKSLNTSFF